MAASPPRIVILGAGYAGAYCAQALERRLVNAKADVVLIDRNNYFVFTPLLVEAGVGALEPRHTVVSIRNFLRSTRFRMAEVLSVDTERREVVCRVSGSAQREPVAYDHLVLALGSVTRLPEVPGLAEHGFGMKSLADAVALRDRAIEMLEAADATDDPARRPALLHFVVVGGNFTGVEVAGEFHTFLREASRQYRNLDPDDCRVTLVELTDSILGLLDPDLGRYAQRQMRRRGVRILLNNSVTRIADDRVELADGATLDTRTVVWCAGIAPSPILRDLPFPKDERGYVLCEPDLRITGCESSWGIGDCAVNTDPEGRAYPATAQHAVREGQHLAANLARAIAGKPTVPVRCRSLGSLAALGCRTGVAKVMGIKLSGFPAWFLWRSVYLMKMPGWARRLRVALDWTFELLFRRDYVQLGVHRER
jgi:NADH dehydrogenase